MKEKLRRLINSQFVRNVTVMASGTIAAQIVTLLLTPIVTRLYGPEAFGIMGTFTAIMNIIAPIAALTYPIAIVLPKSEKNAKGLMRLSIIISIIMSVIAFILLVLFDKQIISTFNLKEVSTYLYLIPFIIIFSGLMQIAEQWVIRKKHFIINARATLYQSLIVNGGKAGIGLIYPSATVLIVLTVLGNGIKALLITVFSRKKRIKEAIDNTDEDKRNLKQLAKDYYDFPLYRAPETFINAVSQGLPVLMLTSFFGPAAAGFYTVGRTTLSLPGRLIGKAVGDVFYPRITEAVYKRENATKLIRQATLILGIIGVLPFGLVIIFGPQLFSFVFGNEWNIAGEYARWIALWTYFGFMNRPSVRSLPALNAQKFHLNYTIIMLVVRIIVLAIGYYIYESDVVSVALFGISGALLNFGLIVITLRISKNKIHIR